MITNRTCHIAFFLLLCTSLSAQREKELRGTDTNGNAYTIVLTILSEEPGISFTGDGIFITNNLPHPLKLSAKLISQSDLNLTLVMIPSAGIDLPPNQRRFSLTNAQSRQVNLLFTSAKGDFRSNFMVKVTDGTDNALASHIINIIRETPKEDKVKVEPNEPGAVQTPTKKTPKNNRPATNTKETAKYPASEQKDAKTKKNEPPGETPPEDISEVIDSTDTLRIATNLPQTVDSFWRDSITPVLTISNVLLREDTLLHQLEVYRHRENTSQFRQILAAVLPYSLPVVAVLLTSLGIWLFAGRRKAPIKAEPAAQTAGLAANAANGPTDDVPATPMPARGEEKDDIQISEIDKSTQSQGPPLALVRKHTDFLEINLSEYWKDTLLQRVYLNKSCIRDLGFKIQQENAYSHQTGNIDELSEIGGFLLGYVYPDGHDRFEVAVSTFVPITPESNNRYTVKFGNTAWSQLDDAFRLYPGQQLVGWFHTHPGHGLFLSDADIKVHNEAFQKPYQFALEADPTTPGCDMAFFTRKSGGQLNNSNDKMIRHWHSFRELEKQAKII